MCGEQDESGEGLAGMDAYVVVRRRVARKVRVWGSIVVCFGRNGSKKVCGDMGICWKGIAFAGADSEKDSFSSAMREADKDPNPPNGLMPT